MKAQNLKIELELMMSKNASMLERWRPPGGRTDMVQLGDVMDMLKSIAANVAQAYAHRVVAEECCARCGGSLCSELQFVLDDGQHVHPGCFK